MKRKILVVIAAALMIWMYPATAQTGTTPEKERERIMVLVNTIAGDYLEQLRRSIQTMKAYANESNLKDESVFEAENDRMIQITRETIGKIRGTVKALHVSS